MVPPQFRLDIAASLDGFIATPEGGVAWLQPYQTDAYGYEAFFNRIGTVILGRTTFAQLQRFGDWPDSGKRGMVLSSQPIGALPNGVEERDDLLEDLVSELQSQRGGDVWIVGGAKPLVGFSTWMQWMRSSCL